MLNTIQEFFDKKLKTRVGETSRSETQRLRIATAALLIEMTRMDDNIQDIERAKVTRALRDKFDLTERETTDLVKLAESEAHQATDYFQFTSLINKGYSAAQKERIIEHLWQVAYADGELDKHEEHLVRKIADLLYVPHATFIATKHRARKAV